MRKVTVIVLVYFLLDVLEERFLPNKCRNKAPLMLAFCTRLRKCVGSGRLSSSSSSRVGVGGGGEVVEVAGADAVAEVGGGVGVGVRVAARAGS